MRACTIELVLSCLKKSKTKTHTKNKINKKGTRTGPGHKPCGKDPDPTIPTLITYCHLSSKLGTMHIYSNGIGELDRGLRNVGRPRWNLVFHVAKKIMAKARLGVSFV